MSVNHSERSLKPSEFTKGGGDAGCEQPGNMQIEVNYSPVLRSPMRPPKPKSIFGQYRSLPRKPGFVSSSAKGTTADVKFHSSTTPRRKVKKASSMEDLTPERRKMVEPSRIKRTMSLTPASMGVGDKQSVVNQLATAKLLASRRIFQAMILNAWRKSRSNVEVLINERNNFGCEVRNLNLQITLLKTLLDSEKERSNKAAADLKDVTAMVEDATEELQAVRKDKEEVYLKLACQDLQQQDIEAKFNHVKKELQIAKNETCELRNRLQSSEEEVSSLRGEKTILVAQVASQNDSLGSRVELIKSLQTVKQDLDERLAAQVTAMVVAKREAEDARQSVTRLQEAVVKKHEDLCAAEALNTELMEKMNSMLREMREMNVEMEGLKARLIENELEMKSRSWSSQLRTVVSLMARVISRVVLLTTN